MTVDQRTPTSNDDYAMRELIPGKLWGVVDLRKPVHAQRVTFHHNYDTALHHCQTGHPR